MTRTRDDRGVSAMLFALMLTALLTMSAFAVDLGAAFTERRHNQNTADAAALSAIVQAVIGGGNIEEVVEEVDKKVETTLGHEVTDEEWADCKDDDPLDYTTIQLEAANPAIDPDPFTECISFSADFSRVRVKIPDQEVMGVFGPSLGFSPIRTNAVAEAQVVNGAGTGAPPFVALSTATTGDFICLRTANSPNTDGLLDGGGPGVAPIAGSRPDPCDDAQFAADPDAFGNLAPYRYLDGCTQQKSDSEVAISIGIDHIMGYFPDGFTGVLGQKNEGDRVDGDPDCTVAFPNTFAIGQGFNAQGLRCALISLDTQSVASKAECNNVTPRFKQGSFLDSTNTFANETLDNSAIWDFLRPADELYADKAPDACVVLATFRDEDDTMDGYTIGTEIPKYYDPVYETEFATGALSDSDWDRHDRFDALTQCLDEWGRCKQQGFPCNGSLGNVATPELFTAEIGTSPRFAFIPQVAEPSLSGKYVHIESFLPIFMYRLYQENPAGNVEPCDPTDPRDTVTYYLHDAGQDIGENCGDSNQNVDRLSSIVMACQMLPSTLCNKETGLPDRGGQDIYEFRLVK